MGQAWKEYVAQRRLKKSRYAHAWQLRQHKLQADGVASWLQASTALTQVRLDALRARAVALAAHTWRVVERCARHWRAVTRTRVAQRANGQVATRVLTGLLTRKAGPHATMAQSVCMQLPDRSSGRAASRPPTVVAPERPASTVFLLEQIPSRAAPRANPRRMSPDEGQQVLPEPLEAFETVPVVAPRTSAEETHEEGGADLTMLESRLLALMDRRLARQECLSQVDSLRKQIPEAGPERPLLLRKLAAAEDKLRGLQHTESFEIDLAAGLARQLQGA